jgi:hypothetical protein
MVYVWLWRFNNGIKACALGLANRCALRQPLMLTVKYLEGSTPKQWSDNFYPPDLGKSRNCKGNPL